MIQFDHRTSPGFAIGRTAHLLRTAVRHAIDRAKIDLSPEETLILIGLASAGKPCSMGYFSEWMLRDATTLTRQIDRLVSKKLVKRQAGESDRRVTMIHLTNDGEKLIHSVFPVLNAVRERALANISLEEIATTIRTLQRMQANLLEE